MREQPALTPRQRDVLALLAEGATNGEIAHRLGLRPNTVKLHVRDVYRRLGVHSRVDAMRAAAARRPVAATADATLSARELQVLGLVADGLSNRAVATALVVSENTIKFHLRRIYARLGVRNRVQAARWLADRQDHPSGL